MTSPTTRFSFPLSLAARLLALFAGLCVLKIVALVQFREQLYQEHWRTQFVPSLPLFITVVLLVALALAWLGWETRHDSARNQRWLHLTLGGGGLVLALLTLSAGEQSYLQIVLDATLKPLDLYDYFFEDFFDRAPWLGAYVAAYAVAWWWCARSKREHVMVWLLALLWLLYANLNLRMLIVPQLELAVLVAVAGALLPASVFKWRLTSWIYLGPFLLALLGWTLFASMEPLLRAPFPAVFAVNLLVLLVVFLVYRINPERALGAVAPLLVALLLFSCHRSYPFSVNYRHVAVVGQSLPLYLLGEALPVVALGAIAWSLGKWQRSRRAVLVLVDLLALFLLIWAYLDLRITGILGTRFTWDALTMTDKPGLVLKSARDYFTPGLWLTLAAMLIGYFAGFILLRCLWLRSPQGARVGEFGWRAAGTTCRRWVVAHPTWTTLALWFILLVPVFTLYGEKDKLQGSAFSRLIGSLPAVKNWNNKPMSPEEMAVAWRELGFPQPTTVGTPPPAPSQPPLNVVVIILESAYNRYLSLFGAKDETQPLLSAYRDRMELFPNFYSSFPNSTHDSIAVLSGLYPMQPYLSYENPRIEAPCLFEILKTHGYQNYLYYSSFRDYARFNDYIGHRSLDRFEDAITMPTRDRHPKVSWGVSEDSTLEAMLAGLDELKQGGKPFCLAYFPVIPHAPYDQRDPRFDVFPPSVLPSFGGDYVNVYKNGLLHMDWVLASLLDGLKERGLLDNTLVVISNDHGEGLGVNGTPVGHGWSLPPELTNNPLILLDPRRPGYRVNPTLSTHVDILPTILARLGFPLPPGELYQGVDLLSPQAQKRRAIYLTSSQDRAIVTPTEYIRQTGETGDFKWQWYRIDTVSLPTSFTPIDPPLGSPPPNALLKQLDTFEQLQNDFLHNYSKYQKQTARQE